jgi:hypothetical protein
VYVCVACEPTPDCVEGPVSESIEWFIEDQDFLRSCDSTPRPPHSPSPVSNLSIFLSLPVCRRSSLLTGEGVEVVGEEPRKPEPL